MNKQLNNVIEINSTSLVQRQVRFNGSLDYEFLDYFDLLNSSEQTLKTYRKSLKQFYSFLKEREIEYPTREDIREYRSYLAENFTVSTQRTYLQTVLRFFNFLSDKGLYENIGINIHLPKVDKSVKKDALSSENICNIEKNIKVFGERKIQEQSLKQKDTNGRIERATEQEKRSEAMFSLTLALGLRTIEISRLKVKDYHREENGVSYILITGKGHNEADQKKILCKSVCEVLNNYLDNRSFALDLDSPLFVSTGNRSIGKPIASTTISTMLKSLMVQSGIDSDRITPHSIRHTTARNMLKVTGNNLYDTQRYMRHSSATTTERYLADSQIEEELILQEEMERQFHRFSSSN